MRTPIANVRGLGSAKTGVHHFNMQRLTAIALIPLALWFVISLVCHLGASHAEFIRWVACPWNTGLLALFFGTMFYHSALGIQVVLEDYVSHEGLKVASLVASKLAHIALAVMTILAMLRIAFTGA